MTAPLIGLAFGLLWFPVGASAVARPAGAVLMGAGMVIFALAAARAVRRGRRPGATFIRKYYVASVIAEVVAILIAQKWLVAHGRNGLLFPIVG